MRVLLTDAGKNFVEILDEQHINENSMKITLPDQNKSTIKSETHRSTSRSRNHFTTKATSARSINNTTENSFPKALDVKMKKIHISKNISDKYNKDNSNNTIILDLPELIQKKLPPTMNSNSSLKRNINYTGDMSDYQFSIKEILPQKTYLEFKKEMKNDLFIKDRNSKIDESMFRSAYKKKTEKEVLEEKMNSKIGCSNVNLIKYLNSRENLNYQFVQKISSFDEERLSKMNKICQKVFDNNEKFELFNKISKEKLNLKKRKDLTEYNEKLDILSKNLFKACEIKNEYNMPSNLRNNKYSKLHEEMKKKFWSNHVEELSKYKRDRKNTKETTSFNYFQ